MPPRASQQAGLNEQLAQMQTEGTRRLEAKQTELARADQVRADREKSVQEKEDRAEREYRAFSKKTMKLRTRLGYTEGPLRYALEARQGIQSKLGQGMAGQAFSGMMDSPLTGLVYGGSRGISSVNRAKRLAYERKHASQLGASGRVARGMDLLSSTSRLTYSTPMALSLMGGATKNVLGTKNLTTMAMSKMGGAMGFSGGGAMMAGMAPYLALAIGSQMMKGRKLAKIRRLQPSRMSQKSGRDHMGRESAGMAVLNQLVNTGQIQAGDYQSAIRDLERNEILTKIYEEEVYANEMKEKAGTGLGDKFKDKEKLGMVDKILDFSEGTIQQAIAKFDPFSQISNFIFGGFKSPKAFQKELRDLYGSADKKAAAKEVKRTGVDAGRRRIISMTGKEAASGAATYEGQSLMMLDLIARKAGITIEELISIRRHGFGIKENMFMKPADEEKSLLGKLYHSFGDFITNIPGLNALTNMVMGAGQLVGGLFKVPGKMFDFFKKGLQKEKEFLFGKEFLGLKDEDAILEATGQKTDPKTVATLFVANALPSIAEDIRLATLGSFEQLQKLVYLQEHGTAEDFRIGDELAKRKEEKVFDPITGQLVSPEEMAIEAKKREQQRAKLMVDAFEGGFLGKLKTGFGAFGGRKRGESEEDFLQRRVERMAKSEGKFEESRKRLTGEKQGTVDKLLAAISANQQPGGSGRIKSTFSLEEETFKDEKGFLDKFFAPVLFQTKRKRAEEAARLRGDRMGEGHIAAGRRDVDDLLLEREKSFESESPSGPGVGQYQEDIQQSMLHVLENIQDNELVDIRDHVQIISSSIAGNSQQFNVGEIISNLKQDTFGIYSKSVAILNQLQNGIPVHERLKNIEQELIHFSWLAEGELGQERLAAARGIYAEGETDVTIGEAGPEVVLPLTDKILSKIGEGIKTASEAVTSSRNVAGELEEVEQEKAKEELSTFHSRSLEFYDDNIDSLKEMNSSFSGMNKMLRKLTDDKKGGLLGSIFGGLKGIGKKILGSFASVFGSAGLGGILWSVLKRAGGKLGSIAGLLGKNLITKAGIPAVIIGGAYLMITDFLKSKERGSDTSQAMSDMFLGDNVEGGLMNGLKTAGKWAGLGAAVGLIAGPPGAIAGALIGGAIGMIVGALGQDRIGKAQEFLDMLFAGEQIAGFFQSETAREWADMGRGIPLIGPIVGGVIGSVWDAIKMAFNWVTTGGAEIQAYLDQLFGGEQVANFFQSETARSWANAGRGIPIVGPILGGVFGSIWDAITGVFSWVSEGGIGELQSTLDEFFAGEQITNFFQSETARSWADAGRAIPLVGPLVGGIAGSVWDSITGVFNFIRDLDISSIGDSIWDLLSGQTASNMFAPGSMAAKMAKVMVIPPVIGPFIGGFVGMIFDAVLGFFTDLGSQIRDTVADSTILRAVLPNWLLDAMGIGEEEEDPNRTSATGNIPGGRLRYRDDRFQELMRMQRAGELQSPDNSHLANEFTAMAAERRRLVSQGIDPTTGQPIQRSAIGTGFDIRNFSLPTNLREHGRPMDIIARGRGEMTFGMEPMARTLIDTMARNSRFIDQVVESTLQRPITVELSRQVTDELASSSREPERSSSPREREVQPIVINSPPAAPQVPQLPAAAVRDEGREQQLIQDPDMSRLINNIFSTCTGIFVSDFKDYPFDTNVSHQFDL